MTGNDRVMLDKARAYIGDGRVRVLHRDGDEAECLVIGTDPRPYVVVLIAGEWACTCPAGKHGRLCAHVVGCALVLGHCQAGWAELHRFDAVAAAVAG